MSPSSSTSEVATTSPLFAHESPCRYTYTMNMFIMKHPASADKKHAELVNLYKEKVEAHNKKVTESKFPDSGFDLFTPYNYTSHDFGYTDNRITPVTFRAPLGVKCAMFVEAASAKPTGYYLYPRSSIVKTPFRLANSVGIIDSGYRGEIMAVVDNINSQNNDISACLERYMPEMSRMFQICSPTLEPFMVRIVDTEEDLGSTERGSGGFGSTGTGAY